MKRIVGFSGGIDSQTVYRWLRNRYGAGDCIALNSQAGRWEHPLTTAFVNDFTRDVATVIEVIPRIKDLWETEHAAETRGHDGEQELTMQLLVAIKKRAPSSKAKFCTEILKLRPQRRWIREAFGPTGEYAGMEFQIYSGVRRDESRRRSETPFSQWSDFYDCEMLCPIADWTKQMCFDYVKSHGEPINPLYTMGFKRVGCMPCIESNKADIANLAERAPDQIQKVRDLESATGKTFMPPMVPGMEMNFIDQAIEWSKTSRGGRQQLFPILHEREACESKYGLCE